MDGPLGRTGSYRRGGDEARPNRGTGRQGIVARVKSKPVIELREESMGRKKSHKRRRELAHGRERRAGVARTSRNIPISLKDRRTGYRLVNTMISERYTCIHISLELL